jgi:hypothetical protein
LIELIEFKSKVESRLGTVIDCFMAM